MLEPWPAPSSSTSPSRSWTRASGERSPSPLSSAWPAVTVSAAGRSPRTSSAGARCGARRATCARARRRRRAHGRRACAPGRRAGISARITGHQSSGTGGFCHSDGSELPFVWVGTTSVPSGPSASSSAATPPAGRRTPSRAPTSTCARAARCRGARRARAGRPRSPPASRAPGWPRCCALHRSRPAWSHAPRERVRCPPCRDAGRRGSGWRCWRSLVAAAPAQAAFERTPIELGPSDGNSPSVVVDPAGTAHVVWASPRTSCATARSRGARRARSRRRCRSTRVRAPVDPAPRARTACSIVVAGRYAPSDDVPETTWAFTSPDGVDVERPRPDRAGVGRARLGARSPPTARRSTCSTATRSATTSSARRSPARRRRPSSTSRARPRSTTPVRSSRCAAGARMAVLGSPATASRTGCSPRAPTRSPTPLDRGAPGHDREADDPRVPRAGRHVRPATAGTRSTRSAAPRPWSCRRFRGDRWARPRGLLYEVDANSDRTALVEDGRGRLHAAIVGNAASGRRACIAYARTRKGRWFTRAVLAPPDQPRVRASGPGPARRRRSRPRRRRVGDAVGRRAPAAAQGRPRRDAAGRTRCGGCPGFPR